MNFAKVFGEGDNQIAAIIKANDKTDQAEVSIFFKPKGLGVCQANFGYPNTNRGWEQAEKFFREFSQKQGEQIKNSVEAQS